MILLPLWLNLKIYQFVQWLGIFHEIAGKTLNTGYIILIMSKKLELGYNGYGTVMV